MDDAVDLAEPSGDLGGCGPRSVDLCQVVVDNPTGRRASLSETDRYLLLADLLEEVAQTR
jgi:hypothetical protein